MFKHGKEEHLSDAKAVKEEKSTPHSENCESLKSVQRLPFRLWIHQERKEEPKGMPFWDITAYPLDNGLLLKH